MKQYEAVIETLKLLGGIATLGKLNQEVLKIEDCEWKTKTPFASIRRIVQLRPEIYKVRRGLWALVSCKQTHEANGIVVENEKNKYSKIVQEFNHAYYQGLLVEIGNERKWDTYVPNQDRNKQYSNNTLGDVSTLKKIPPFTYDRLMKRCSTIDVIWFNNHGMLNSLFEIEHSTDIKNSLLKYTDLKDFYTNMYIVADEHRRTEFDRVMNYVGFEALKNKHRVQFIDYASVEQTYERVLLSKKIKCTF